MTTATTLREGIGHCRDTLGQVAWSPRWVDAEPRLRDARDALAAELSWYYVASSTDETVEILRTAADEALQLVLRALMAGIAADVRGEDASREVRRLVAEAITTLDEVL